MAPARQRFDTDQTGCLAAGRGAGRAGVLVGCVGCVGCVGVAWASLAENVALFVCAEMAYALAHRAQAGDAFLGMGFARVGDARVECGELGLAGLLGGARGDGGSQQGGRENGHKSLFHHACLLFFRGRPVARGKVMCSARRVRRRALGSPGAARHAGIFADFGRRRRGPRILFDRPVVFPL